MSRLDTFPLFGTGISAISKVITAQRRVNCFWDIRKDEDKSQAVLVGTPGLILWASLPTYPVRGWRVVGSFLYVVAGSVLYQVSGSGTATALGTLNLGLYNKVSMSDNLSQLMIVDGSALYCYALQANPTALQYQIQGNFGIVADFSAQVLNLATTITFFDGRFIVEMINSRQAYASKSYDGTDWGGGVGSSVVFWTKEQYSDNMSAVDALGGFLIMFGEASLEYWQDVGASPLPYQRITGATQKWGLAAKWSRAEVENTMIFLGKNPQGHVKIVQINKNGYAPVVLSTSDVDDIINDMGSYADAIAYTYVAFGHVMYQITFPTGGRTLLYDTMTDAWQEAQTGAGILSRHQGDLGVSFGLQNYVSDYQNGNIYYLSEYAYTDNGTPIMRQVVSKHIRDAGNDFSVSEVFLDMETGVGLQSGQGSDPQIWMEKSKDGGKTFGQPRPRSMGKVGQYQSPRVTWRRNGIAKDFVFRFTVTDPVRFILTGGSVAR